MSIFHGVGLLERGSVRCPQCGPAQANPLRSGDRHLVCSQGHRFDAARQGYVNLLVGAGTKFTPDSGEMVAARERVQASGVYEPLKRAVQELLPRGPLLDAGCGTGYYAEGLENECTLAFDLSKHAVRRAARLPRTLALVWDAWRPLPLEGASVTGVLNVFAPHNLPEFARVLAPGGSVVVVTPAEGHLEEARDLGIMLGQAEAKTDALDAAARGCGLRLSGRSVLETRLSPDAEALADLAFMGPAGHHRTREEILGQVHGQIGEGGRGLGTGDGAPGGPGGVPAEVTARFEISQYKRAGSAAGDRPSAEPVSR